MLRVGDHALRLLEDETRLVGFRGESITLAADLSVADEAEQSDAAGELGLPVLARHLDIGAAIESRAVGTLPAE